MFLGLILFFTTSLFAVDFPILSDENHQWPIDAFYTDYNYEGIVKMYGCSGSLVRFETSQDSDFALVLTNGHCVKFIEPGGAIYNQPVKKQFWLYDENQNIEGLHSTHLVYATMTKTDMALYQLEMTYAEIQKKFNIRAMTLFSQGAMEGDSFELISGYWQLGLSCSIEKIVPTLREDAWFWQDSLRYTKEGCVTQGGTSGSPLILPSTRTVIGIHNTRNERGRECAVNNPCEINEDNSVEVRRHTSYGQQIHWIYSCLTDTNKVDLSLASCNLPKP